MKYVGEYLLGYVMSLLILTTMFVGGVVFAFSDLPRYLRLKSM